MKKTNTYPVILVHGFLCWGDSAAINRVLPLFGMWNGSAKMTVLEQGIPCATPGVGPFSGMWDRACDLYAQIKGGTCDYGYVHSKRNGHERYGRTYPGIVPNWGELDENEKIQKINIVGHSFGGPTVRTLIHLLAEGSAEEREGTPAGETLSPLFEGGKEKWIHSCTTLAATHEGVTLPDAGRPIVNPMAYAVFGLGNLVSGTPIAKLYDFDLDRFHLSSKTQHYKLDVEGLKKLVHMQEDNIFWELSTEGGTWCTKDYKTYDNIYYFSYSGCRTDRLKKYGGVLMLPTKDMWLPLRLFSIFECLYTDAEHGKEWQANDGLVNVPCAQHPAGAPWQEFETAKGEYKPGIWYVMPTENKDHTSYMGVLEKPEVYKQFFIDLVDRITDLPVIE